MNKYLKGFLIVILIIFCLFCLVTGITGIYYGVIGEEIENFTKTNTSLTFYVDEGGDEEYGGLRNDYYGEPIVKYYDDGTIVAGYWFEYFSDYLEKGSCEGIDEFYTGDGFYKDSEIIKELALENYNKTAEEGDDILPPYYIYSKGVKFDCEDTSNALQCLGELYKIKCRKYLLLVEEEGSTYGGHLGIECYERGRWKIYN